MPNDINDRMIPVLKFNTGKREAGGRSRVLSERELEEWKDIRGKENEGKKKRKSSSPCLAKTVRLPEACVRTKRTARLAIDCKIARACVTVTVYWKIYYTGPM
jgi:hypothetical protein